MQLQAGYILSLHRSTLYEFAKKNDRAYEPSVNGLLRQLSTFEVRTDLNLNIPIEIPSVCAVALNLITRGLPTLSTHYLEKAINNASGIAFWDEDKYPEKVRFDWAANHPKTGEDVFQALHAIFPISVPRASYINDDKLESNFERAFIYDFIPGSCDFLVQMFEMQRTRESIKRGNNQGRVDFSIESPYDHKRVRTNKFGAKRLTKHHELFIAEVDGRRYHSDLLDDLKDFEIAQFSNTIKHITEDRLFEDVNSFLDDVLENEYIKRCRGNFENADYLVDPFTATCLVPFAVARIQLVVLRYFLGNLESLTVKGSIRIAIIEQDLPCGHLALTDLKQLLNNLYEITDVATGPKIPAIEWMVFCEADNITNPLHLGQQTQPLSELNSGEFDCVIDVSILKKEGTFKETYEANNLIRVRNAHYIHYKTQTPVYSAPRIKYKQLVKPLSNEEYTENHETTQVLRCLLRDIFRNDNFKVGQLPILNRAMQLESVIGLLPTGGGKSLTYQLAALLQPGATIIVDPIRSLMLDQFLELREIGIDKCEFINSTQTTAERKYNQNELLRKGMLQFLFVSPERFVIDEFRKSLTDATENLHFFAYVVIDEVHCVSEWGHDFRIPYLNLGENAQDLCKTQDGRPVPLFGLTATASFDVLTDVERELKIRKDDGSTVVRYENTLRDEINYRIIKVNADLPNIDDEFSIRETIGKVKQNEIFGILSEAKNYVERYNDEFILTEIIKTSFNEYIPMAERADWIKTHGSEELAFQAYLQKKLDKLNLDEKSFKFVENNDGRTYNYGLIVFMPHRRGWFGIENSNSSKGVYENDDFVRRITVGGRRVHLFGEDTLGFFMGSGEDAFISNKIIRNKDEFKKVELNKDEESFYHLERFKENKNSIMVATKAFGMGINKPNVRMTIHFNLPQSIESFVQEAGRAGRDGRLANSILIYNENIGLNGLHVDRDILLYFHSKAFRGKMKEHVLLSELLQNITYPNTTRLEQLSENINELWSNDNFSFKIKLGNQNDINRLFVNASEVESVGYLYLNTLQIEIYKQFSSFDWAYEMVNHIKDSIPSRINNTEKRRLWFNETVLKTRDEIGIQNIINELTIESVPKEVQVPFTNKYLSKKANIISEFILNKEHENLVLNCVAVKELLNLSHIGKNKFIRCLKEAVFKNIGFDQFIETLELNNDIIKQKITNSDDADSLEFQRAYYCPRSQEDTAKAIYRLVSIGVINTYTIDYQNGLYKLYVKKQERGYYFNRLKQLLEQYTSSGEANSKIGSLMERSKYNISRGYKTEIEVCLDYLTKFIYDKIKLKRLRSIEDMVKLCSRMSEIDDEYEQNRLIKEEIYYHFNAKYAREDYAEDTVDGKENAYIYDDIKVGLSFEQIVDKYVRLVEDPVSGEFINNIKHLRGSTMKLLSEYPENPSLMVLKSFSLFVLADKITNHIEEAIKEFIQGLIKQIDIQKSLQDGRFNFETYIDSFKEKLIKHVAKNKLDDWFGTIEDRILSKYWADWSNEFSNKFLKEYNEFMNNNPKN